MISSIPAGRRPVIVAIGEICDRPADIAAGLDPIGLMVAAAREAERELGLGLAERLDAVEIVHQVSWRYEDTAQRVCERLGIRPARAVYHPGGGESPLRLLHDAALRIAAGESRLALVCGGEAQSTSKKARAAGIELPWPARARLMEHPWEVEHKISAMGRAHGIAQPTFIYPFYENATLKNWGQTPAQAHAEAARLWEAYSRVAATNPFAWQKTARSAAEIAEIAAGNPLIAWPYPRLMVANPTVNQGAAVFIMAEGLADELAVPAEHRIHLLGGAAAKEPDDYLHRHDYTGSPAQQVVLEAAGELAPPSGFDALELYSCFPCVPKMAGRQLALGEDAVPTVTGGLTFFGGPFNNYMLHATCAMVRRLRGTRQVGLLYGQGDWVTKHHSLVVSGSAGACRLEPDYRRDGRADALRGELPRIVDRAEGIARLETFTILPDRSGGFDRGLAILRLPDGSRTMARVPAHDTTTLARLADRDRSPIGLTGRLATAADALLEWTLT